ncbi:MAG: DUF1553 domain-containing protein [Verrucomicrobiales bacterium]|nr:DUF1553 domain-containing protein [Verrucomicrobiales bacterium]
MRLFLLCLCWLPLCCGAQEFNRDIRPILSENCFACHGPDAKGRKGDLRLDVAGADLAEVIRRVTTTDADEVMPPPSSHKPRLTTAQVDTLRRWIDAGAAYQKHWAFEPLPAVAGDMKPAEIDSLVEASLQDRGLSLAPPAAEATLIRRAALDLTGLPPSEALLDQPYEAAVESLLASPHFGEHLAVAWLDLARYADTNGYFGDKPRQMWLWRDWVIEAGNANMPFDRFSIVQLAGDLLPGATLSQRIATGFNRNHMANNESGAIDEEFRVEYVVDRVDTTLTTWLGLTAGCAQCHDHKYDPISQREFYQLFSFFNNVPEQGLIRADNPPPVLAVPGPEQEAALSAAESRLSTAEQAWQPVHAAVKTALADWESRSPADLPPLPADAVIHLPLGASQLGVGTSVSGTAFAYAAGVRGEAAEFDATRHVERPSAGFDPDRPWTIGLWLHAEGSLGCPLSLIEPEGNRRGLELIWQKGRLQVNLVHRWGASAIEVATVEALGSRAWHHIAVRYDGSRRAGGLQVFFDGKPTTLEVRRDTLDGSLATSEPIRIGRRDAGLGYYGLIDEVRFLPEALDPAAIAGWSQGERLRGILETPPEKRAATDSDRLLDFFLDRHGDPSARQARRELLDAREAARTLRDRVPVTLVMEEMKEPRPAHVLERGQYDQPGERVQPGVPVAIAPWSADLPPNRLGFARWLFAPENPLTARVAVNRLWAQCFGEGLVRTPNDFGSQGEAPTHPELLDRLAAGFRADGWDVKALLRSIVLSRAYRQSSRHIHPGDPGNRWLARGPGGRLSAETLRDQALALSGLLVPKLGGPSVKPFQPPGLWEAVSYNGEDSYVPDTGDGLWRRSLYTYVKRQSPHPLLLTFDGPTREKCTARRARTSTPLQALLLLNDETFLLAAEAFAERSTGRQDRLGWMFRAATGRLPDAEERRLLEGLRQRHDSWPLVAHTILNLDETISKR